MKNTVCTDPLKISRPLMLVSLAASAGAIVFLASLHVLSPELDPSWRVVSEYALGRYAWVLSFMFLSWAIGSWALVFGIRSQVRTLGGRIGLVFLLVAGAGEALAAPFDVTWPRLHGLAGLLGVPSLPIAAMLISVSLGRAPAWARARRSLLWTANLTWMSLALMVAAMCTLRNPIGGVQVPIGWPNRLLVTVYALWVISVAWQAIRLRRRVSEIP